MVRTLLGVIIKYAYISAAIGVALYATLIGLLRTPSFQAHVVYLHKLELTWFRDLNVPEMFGFLHNQVTPFCIKSPGGGDLYAWHILPVELYRKHEQALIAEPSGFVSDITSRLSFELLREDPEARLVLHFHGAGGTVGSGYRASNYRALFAGQPEKIHVLTFDYRGYGRSNGTPSEQDIILDAIAVVDWATNIAGILPSRILIFGQSLGTAVSSAVSEYFTIQSPPVAFAGTILVAPFVIDTYVHRSHCGYFGTFVRDKWPSQDRIARYVQTNEASGKKYRLTLIHAEDDYDIPSYHTQQLFQHAVNATVPGGITLHEFESKKNESKTDLGAAGSVVEWETQNGVIREEILKYGSHDVIMDYPVITMAVMRIFTSVDPSFK